MKLPNHLTTFLFEFYNYARHVKDNDTLGDKKQEIAKLAQNIDAQKYKSLCTDAPKSKETSLSEIGAGDDTDDETDRRSSNHVRTSIQAALREAGFKVIPQYFDDFEPLVEVGADVLCLLRS